MMSNSAQVQESSKGERLLVSSPFAAAMFLAISLSPPKTLAAEAPTLASTQNTAWYGDTWLFDSLALLLALALLATVFLASLAMANRQRAQKEAIIGRFKDFVETSADWMWELDSQFRLTYVSDRYAEATGIQPLRVLGMKIQELLWNAESESREELFAKLREHRPFRNFLLSTPHKNRETRFFRLSGKPLFDGASRFVGYRGTAKDVTDLRVAQENLSLRSIEFHTVFEQAPHPIGIGGTDGRIFRTNPAFSKLLGYSREELKALKSEDITHPDDREITKQAYRKILKSDCVETIEKRYVAKDGHSIHALLTMSAIRDSQGRVRGLIAQVVDISDSKRAEAELRNAIAAAQTHNRAKSQFLANMSHELRTPLNAIIGFSEILENEMFGPIGSSRYRDYARDIRLSGMHLLDLINDILDVSRVEAGKTDLNKEAFNPVEAIDECLKMVQPSATSGGLTILRDFTAAPSSIVVDRRAFKQILLNLLSNAIKYTMPGGQVTVGARRRGSLFELWLEDTGIGIEEKDLARLGRPFEQIENVFNRKHQGTGLGLSLCRSLAELHGGRLRIASALGSGTTVTVELPQGPLEDAKTHPAAADSRRISGRS
jgi:PAS domain S-box-containing protein